MRCRLGKFPSFLFGGVLQIGELNLTSQSVRSTYVFSTPHCTDRSSQAYFIQPGGHSFNSEFVSGSLTSFP